MNSSPTARVPGEESEGRVPRKPFAGKRRLFNGVSIRLDGSRRSYVFDCGELIVRPGDVLVVQADKGPQIGRATGIAQRHLQDAGAIRRVVRRANPDDLKRAEECVELVDRARRAAVAGIRKQRLDMKLVHVEYMLDKSRALIYFSSEKRVDFRNLVGNLARQLGTRIEMRHVGLREGAGMIGGIGPCGEDLCCSRFLTSFASVSVRHAKVQGLSLNPQKVTGMCGRLKCCMVYEEPVYKEMNRYAPKKGTGVMTAEGRGTIVDVDSLSRRVQVLLPGGTMTFMHLRDVVAIGRPWTRDEYLSGMTREEEVLNMRRQRSGNSGRSGGGKQATGVLDDTYLWTDLEQDADELSTREGTKSGGRSSGSGSSGRSGKSKRRRRSRRSGSGSSGGGTQSGGSAKSQGDRSKASGAQKASGPGQGDGPKRRRRRRPRRGGGGSQSGGAKDGGSKDGGSKGGGSKGGGGGPPSGSD